MRPYRPHWKGQRRRIGKGGKEKKEMRKDRKGAKIRNKY